MKTCPLWEQICLALKSKIADTAFEAWIKPIQSKLNEQSKNLILEVPNEFFKDWVVQHYDLKIRDLLKNLRPELGLDYRVDLEAATAVQISPPDRQTPARLLPHAGFLLNPKYTFENFVVGPSNRFTHAACMAIAEAPAKAYNPLFIYGGVGLGKTHLMQAICHHIKKRAPQTKFYFTPSEKFTNELISAIQHRSTQAFRDKFRNIDVLLIDDVQFIAGREATQEEFFNTFNALYDNHKQIILTSDRPPKEIQKLEDRLVSRFGWGLVTDIQPPDLETRVAILNKKVENEAVQIPSDVIFFIAEAIKTNIRELEGALVRIIAYSLLEEKKITLEMAKNALKDLLRETQKIISVESILRTVADFYKLLPQDLKTKKRIKTIVLPRQIAMFLTRELTPLSLPEIGHQFGGKDHTTVLHAYRKIKQNIETDPQLRTTIERLSQDINMSST